MADAPSAGAAVGELDVVGAEPVDAGKPAGVPPEPAEVGHRVVVGLQDVDVAGRESELGAGVGAEAG